MRPVLEIFQNENYYFLIRPLIILLMVSRLSAFKKWGFLEQFI